MSAPSPDIFHDVQGLASTTTAGLKDQGPIIIGMIVIAVGIFFELKAHGERPPKSIQEIITLPCARVDANPALYCALSMKPKAP